MDKAKKHWKILEKLESDLAKRVRSFMVIGRGGEGVLVATEDGQAFWFGTMQFEWSDTKTMTKPIPLDVPYGLAHMAQGNSHILLLNKRGAIYSMGMNSWGQLGLGINDIKSRFSPQLISIPHEFISVRCGHGHSLALNEDGKVWAWGRNDSGQVGVPCSTESLSFPRQIPELDPHRVVAIECGCRHSLALTNQGEVYGWGNNGMRQLGDGSGTSKHTPTRILTPSPVKSMAAGYSHTLLLTQTGEVYSCGWNGRTQLGLIPTTTNPCLCKVSGLPPISQIASHPATFLSIAISFDHRCFVWGKLLNRTTITTPRELPSVYSTVESPLSSFSSHGSTPHSVQIPWAETPSSGLSARMSQMFDNPETSDVQFLVEQRTIHAHRIILKNSSDYFELMFSERWMAPVDPEDPITKVTIPDHSYEAFHAFLRFLYTDCLEVQSDLLFELFELASKYLDSDLPQLCLSRLRATLTPANCCHYYQLSLRHTLPELVVFQQEVVQFISTNFFKVISTEAYQSMDKDFCKSLTLSMAKHSP